MISTLPYRPTVKNVRNVSTFSENSLELPTWDLKFRKASAVFSCMEAVCLCYASASILLHTRREKLARCEGNSQSKTVHRSTFILNMLTLWSFSSLIVYVVNQLPIFYDFLNWKTFCPIYHRIRVVFFGSTITFAYLAVWYRVHLTFYANAILKTTIGKVARAFDYATPTLILFIAGSNYAIFLSGPPYVGTSQGCAMPKAKRNKELKWYVIIGAMIFCQLLLLASPVLPLLLHRQKMRNSGCHVYQKNYSVIRRCVIATVVGVASDILAFLFAALFLHSSANLSFIVYSVDLIIHLITLIGSVTDWKKKLFSFCQPCDTQTTTVKGRRNFKETVVSSEEQSRVCHIFIISNETIVGGCCYPRKEIKSIVQL